MKLKTLILFIMTLVVSTFGLKYITTDPIDDTKYAAAVTALEDKGAGNAGEVFLVTDDGTDVGWNAVSCSAKADLKAALQADLSSDADFPRGPCCINAHHRLCILEQQNIRLACNHTGKGGLAGTCPQ